MVNLSIAIMHCPAFADRRKHVEKIVEKISVKNIQQKVVDFNIFSDWYQKGLWFNARRSWMWCLSTKSTHHLVLQDDVIICNNFIDTIINCIKTYPDSPLGLYANRKICEEAKLKDIRWVSIPDGVWGQAILLPRFLVEKFLNWERKHILPNFKYDDTRIAMFLVENKINSMCPMPSLVDHEGAATSTLGHSNKNRRARWFEKDKNYLDYDWSNKKFLQAPLGLKKDYYNYYVK